MSRNRPKISKRLRKSIYEHSDKCCYYCGCKLAENTYKADHKYPFSKGGKTDFSNLVPCCRTCNTVKADYTIDEFRRNLISLANKTKAVSTLIRNKYNLIGKVTSIRFHFEEKTKEDVWRLLLSY